MSGHGADRSRTLPPLPRRHGSRVPFAESWWGNAWVQALEETSLDQGRLSRGRTYARGGYVDAITVTPGRIAARVHGSRTQPYRTSARLETLSDGEWDAFLEAVAAQPGHIAALLEKEMPQDLVDAARTAGVRLLPGAGELRPHCSCPDHGYPCKHAAALCYQAARFLDADPFVLLLLRGRGESELFDELARRNAALAAARSAEHAGEPAPVAGVGARAALATTVRPPLPEPLDPPSAPGTPPLLPDASGGDGPEGGVTGSDVPGSDVPGRDIPDAGALEFLATDAAARAQAFLTGGPDPFAPLSPWQDTVRLAATHPRLTGRRTFSPFFAALAQSAGRTAQDLARAVAAWRQGGETGLEVLENPWDPPAGDFDRARGALSAADLPRMSIRRNHLTDAAGVHQLRYGRDGRWYPYRSEAGREDWWPEGPADADPVGALAGSFGS